MSPDEKVIHEAERWFRALLRASTVSLRPHEFALFTALAERQNARGSIYVPKDSAAITPELAIPDLSVEVSTTLRPSPTKMKGLIERSKKPDAGAKK